jgi:hypothetical protein
LTQATTENIFVGAVVKNRDKIYNVYKVNSNTIWAGELPTENVLNQWENKPKGMTWVALMKRTQSEKFNITRVLIDETKNNNKEIFKNEKKNGRNKNNRLKSCCVREVMQCFDAYKKGKSYRYPVECNCGKNLNVLKIEDNDDIVMRTNLDYIIFDHKTKEEKYIKTIGDSNF